MTTYLQYLDPFQILWRDEPYPLTQDTIEIANSRAVLSEIPDKLQGVVVSGYTQIFTGSPTATQFLVNYVNGVMTFNSSENGTTITADFYAKGVYLIPAERIFLQGDLAAYDLQTYLENLETSTTLTNSNNDVLFWMGV